MKPYRLLCLLLLAILLTGCSGGGENGPQETTPAAGDTQPPAAGEQDPLAHLPDVQYGETFDVLVRLQDQNTNYIYTPPTELSTTVDEEVYAAYDAVAERFDVDFKFTGMDGYSSGQEAFLNTIITDVNAGGSFDLVAPSYYFGVTLVTQGYYRDLNTLSAIDFSQPWWYDGFNDTCELYNQLYVCAGAYDIGNLTNTYCLVFNEDLIASYGLDSPYDLYDRNEWTFEKMMEMAAEVGDVEGGEIVGVALTRKSTDCLFQASGLKFVDKNQEGEYYVSMYSDQAETLYQRLSAYIGANNNVYKYGGMPNVEFPEGKTLIAAMTLGNTASLRNSNIRFGVTVFPKYQSSQDSYYSTTAGSSVFAVIKNAPDPEMSAVILEALNAKFHQHVTPAIFEQTLQGKVANQPKAASMMEVIRDTLYFDFGFIYSASLANIASFTSFIESGSYETMSLWYHAKEEGYKSRLDAFLEDYRNIPNLGKEN